MADSGDAVKPDVITREVDSSDVAVAEVRKEVQPTEVGASVPIDRLPLKPNLVMLANAGVTTAAFGSTDRCIRVISVPTKGGASVQCHCSRPCVRIGTDKLCPEHDAAAFQPSQTPVPKGRTINSASIKLSKAELKDCGIEEEPALLDAPASPTAAPVVSRPLAPIKPEEGRVQIIFTLEELAGGDVLKVFRDRACEALDSLPCANLKQMKQMAAIQAKIARIARKARKPKEGISNDAE